jgi:hypothetical protein
MHSESKTETLLNEALLFDGKMEYELYKYELEEYLEDLKTSMANDNDNFIFALTHNSGDVAMVLVKSLECIYINEGAREYLKAQWKEAYTHNLKKLIPDMAISLDKGEIIFNGVKYQPTELC